jgi:hypothetical protein
MVLGVVYKLYSCVFPVFFGGLIVLHRNQTETSVMTIIKAIKSMTNKMVMPDTEVNMEKVDLVKPRIRRKNTVWFSFLFLGWSYGSLGNLGLQILWYLIPALTAYGWYENHLTSEFTVFTSIAVVGLPIWFIWTIFRMATLNKAIERYNQELADFFGLNQEEKAYLDI